MRQLRLIVNAYEKALIFRNGELIRVLDSGKYWVGPWVKIVKYDVTELFYHSIDIDLLMKNDSLASRVQVFDVPDNEIAIQYKNENFFQVLAPGRYVYWNDGIDYTYDFIDLNKIEVENKIARKVLQNHKVMKYVSVHNVENFEKGLMYIDGEFYKELKPGIYYFWKGEHNITVSKVDTRKLQMEINGQELLTADKATVRMTLFASYQVKDIFKALVECKDYARQLYIQLQLGLRQYVGQFTLDQLLKNKSEIAPYILDFSKETAAEIGVELLNCGVKDIILPGDIRTIMNQVLIAEKTAQANTIMRREETASTRSLLNTAKLMEDNEMLFKLKEMEYMEKIADKIGEISVNGGGRVVDQLRDLVGAK